MQAIRSTQTCWALACALGAFAACGDDEDRADRREDGGAEPHDAGDGDSMRDGQTEDGSLVAEGGLDGSVGDGSVGDGSVGDGSVGDGSAGDGRVGDGSVGDGSAGDGSGSDAGLQTGSRLELRGVSAGGLFALSSIYDRELQRECAFLRTTELGAQAETYHCVPLDFAELRYLDADCSQPVVRWNQRPPSACQASDPFPIVRAASVAACGTFRVMPQRIDTEAPLALDSVYRRASGSGECVAETVSNAIIYPALPGALDALVTARLEVLPTADPALELEVYVGDDGSRVRSQLRWSDGERCSPQTIDRQPDSLRCLPQSGLSPTENVYADDACSALVFTGTTAVGCGPEPQWSWGITYGEVEGCYYPNALYELGAVVSSAYAGSPEACMSFDDPPENWRMHPVTAERALSDVPEVRRVYEGEGRVQLEHHAAQDGTPIYAVNAWRDLEREQACMPQLFADGRVRCLNAYDGAHEGLYADAACSVPAYWYFVDRCGPNEDGSHLRAQTEFSTERCERVVTALFSLQRHTGAVYRNLGGCAETTLDPSGDVFVDGAELDAAALPELQRTTW